MLANWTTGKELFLRNPKHSLIGRRFLCVCVCVHARARICVCTDNEKHWPFWSGFILLEINKQTCPAISRQFWEASTIEIA
jgi:type IV secretory pathway VirB3-like protein